MESTPESNDLVTIPIRCLQREEDKTEVAILATRQSPAAAEVIEPCPRCGGVLINPERLGWCPKCRYCKALEENAPKVDLTSTSAPKASPLGIVEFINLVSQ